MRTIYHFWAPWCGPCKAAEDHWNKFKTENALKATFVNINIDTKPEIADKFNINSIPAFVSVDPFKDSADSLTIDDPTMKVITGIATSAKLQELIF